jgi:hypothetical protein
MAVEGGLADSGAPGDVVNGHAHAMGSDELREGVHYRAAVPLSLVPAGC